MSNIFSVITVIQTVINWAMSHRLCAGGLQINKETLKAVSPEILIDENAYKSVKIQSLWKFN